MNILTALFNSIPSFWGSTELNSVISFYLLGYHGSSNSRLNKLIKLIAKQVKGATLLPTLCNMWLSVRATPTTVQIYIFLTQRYTKMILQAGSQRVGIFFEVVRRSLHHCTRADVLNELRPLTDLFLVALNCREDLVTDDIKSVNLLFVC